MNNLLLSYIPITDMIAQTFGRGCEVVLHDLSQPQHSVIHVANGSVTGRQVGQSFDHLIRQVLLNQRFGQDNAVNYFFDLPDGRRIKSSSSLIRDQNGEVAGMLCINYDITALQSVRDQLGDFLTEQPEAPRPENSLQNPDIMGIVDALIERIVGGADAGELSRKKCVELIRFMDEKGVFLVKGAVDKVASVMGVSRVTVYSYLDEAKGKR